MSRVKTESDAEAKPELLRFRTGAGMPARLGSEQLKDEITAVLELVKNAYDADASEVRVEFRDNGQFQSIRIQDNGSGMTRDDLESKWFVLGTENKVRDDRSPKYRRRRLGQKGVGRFAAEKLGGQLTLRTRTAGETHMLEIQFNWDELSGDRDLSDFGFAVRRSKSEAYEPPNGTRLEIRRLRLDWKKPRVQKARSQLARLIDPESTAADFKIVFLSPWEDLNGPLENPLPGKETHRIDFEITAEGVERLRIHRGGQTEERTQTIGAPLFGEVRGRLRYFGQGLASAERSRGGDPDADWNVGVRVFRDGCRVRPYGEPGPDGDWLQIYRSRYLRGSRFRLKPHYLEGSVHISGDQNPALRDTTSREGLNANDAYAAFVSYVQERVVQLSDLIREEEIHEERSRMQERYKRALDPLTGGLNQVRSDEYRRAVESADASVRKTLKPSAPPVIRNAHWECLDCLDSWKAPRELVPILCREHSVGRDGKPSKKSGCGSASIRRKENLVREEDAPMPTQGSLDDVMAGLPAYVSGTQLRPLVDWDMGENDEEAEVRPERRELAVNGRHRAFRAADKLDGNETVEGTALEALRAVAALTVHVINAAAMAWGKWHFQLSGGQFDLYLTKTAELKLACLQNIAGIAEQAQT